MERKLFIVFVILVLIGVLTTGFLSLSLLKVNYLNNIEEKLISNAVLIKEFLNNKEGNALNLDSLATTYSKNINARVTFINNDGEVLGDSDINIESLENHRNRPEIKMALKGEIGVNKRYSNSLENDMFYVAIPLIRDNNILVIRLAVLIEELNYYNKTLFKYIILSILTGLLVAFILGFRFVRTVTNPIIQLTRATKKISQGNYGEKVNYRTDDELGILAQNFNNMSTKLQDTICELQESNTKMKAILTSMINGVIALDNSKRVTFINSNAEDIFGIKEEKIKGKYVLEAFRNNPLDDLIENLIYKNVMVKEELEVFNPEHRILNIYSNPIRLTDNPNRTIGVLIIIEDITEIRKLERMRKDFVANVSHELKTPLTSIKGFIETLKDGAVEDKKVRDKFLDIVDIEAGRLTSLIQDLLLLSEIENRNTVIDKEAIEVNESIEEVTEFLGELAKAKGITIDSKINNNLPNIYGKKGWFKQMLINLIDNAIKYTPKGGKVTLTGYTNRNNLIIKVKDSGMGIEEKHLKRLFERFYRVDKARSRQVGGTGLGLAIVKHIVLSFKGDISVKSELNKGTEFVINLPIESKE